MANIQKNFSYSLDLYQTKRLRLPSKISWKLDLIVNLIEGRFPRKELFTLEQQMEYEDLEQCDDQSLKLIFNNIIDTLFSQTATESEKCLIKKKGIFSNWTHAVLTYNQQHFLITHSNKTYSFKIEQCQIKKCRQSKRSFELCHQDAHKYSIKLKNEQQMKRVLMICQRQIIELKTRINYLEMSTLIVEVSPSDINKVQLCVSPSQRRSSPDQKKIKTNSLNVNFKKSTHNQSMHSPQQKKRIKAAKNSKLKPVPYGYVSRFQNDKTVIAFSEGQKAKIYIQYNFTQKTQLKKIVSLFLLQKPWNTFLVQEDIKKQVQVQNQILICRKYDTFDRLGQFTQLNLKVLYTSLDVNMSMLTCQSIPTANLCQSLQDKCFITFQSQNDTVKIFIEDELKSNKFGLQELKQILFDIHKQIIKLELLHDKVVIKNFEAQTIVNNLLEDQQSTNTQSQEDIFCFEQRFKHLSKKETINEKKDSVHERKVSVKQRKDPIKQICYGESYIQRQNQKQFKDELKILKNTFLLKSPCQIPNFQFINAVRSKQFQNNYFRYPFQSKILPKYDNYQPYYKLEKMIQNKIYQVIPSRELKFIDQELINSQKQTVRFILRQIGGNFISGKSVFNLSLPVDIFQSRSGLERSASSYANSPDFFIARAYSPPLQQMIYVTGYIAQQLTNELMMQKPFNPILGQTFQGYIKGIPIYYEHINHNPPTSAYFLTCPEYTMYGNFMPYADLGLNTGIGANLGTMHIVFPNGTHFQCYFPPSEVAGIVYGDRKFRSYNKGFIVEKANCLFSQFSMQNPKKDVYQTTKQLKVGQIVGGIYKVKPQFFDEIDKYKLKHKNLKKFYGLSKQFIVQKIHSVSGQWFGQIYVDDRLVNEFMSLYPIQYAKNILPSDCNFRLDVLYHKLKDFGNSQKQKQVLEVIQRNDRKLREKYAYESKNKK